MPTVAPHFDNPARKGLKAVLYARVSTRGDKQDARTQLGALRSFARSRGWEVVATERDAVSGDPRRRRGDPPGLRAALRRLADREAHVLCVFSADRLVRSPTALISLVDRVQSAGGHVASMQDGADLDTTTDHGELFLFLRGWWARMEMRLIRARVKAGLERAKAKGIKLGRKRLDDGIDTRRLVRAREGGASWATLAKMFPGTSSATIRRRHAEALRAREGN